MSERIAFVRACISRRRKIVDICSEFGISEKTGYKILSRFKQFGEAGLEDRSHAVLEHPFRITEEVQQRVLALKREHPHYGPQTIHDRLVQHEPLKHWPAASSIGELLKRNGLVCRRRRRDHNRERAPLDSCLTRGSEPNLVWTADFKGQFRLNTGLGRYCYPLTVMDLSSRFALGLKALETTSVEPTRKEFTRIFREYGLPSVIRTDNGVPFAQPNAIGRLGQLALWWVRLGIKPEHIRPGRPSENGSSREIPQDAQGCGYEASFSVTQITTGALRQLQGGIQLSSPAPKSQEQKAAPGILRELSEKVSREATSSRLSGSSGDATRKRDRSDQVAKREHLPLS